MSGKPICPNCKMPMAMKESIEVGRCMACRPWFVGVDIAAQDSEFSAVKCWCGEVAKWRPTERRPSGCKRCGARFDFRPETSASQ